MRITEIDHIIIIAILAMLILVGILTYPSDNKDDCINKFDNMMKEEGIRYTQIYCEHESIYDACACVYFNSTGQGTPYYFRLKG